MSITEKLSIAVDRPYEEKREGAIIASISPHTSRLSLVTSLHDLLDLEDQWHALEASDPTGSHIFQSFAWISTWARSYLSFTSAFELCILTGFEGSRLVFVLPLMRKQQFSLNLLTWATEPAAQYGDVLLAPGQNLNNWMNNALSLLKRLKNIDAIYLRHVRQDANIANYLRQNFYDAHLHEKAYALDLSQYADEKAYDRRYSATQRRRRKKIRRKLETAGRLSFNPLAAGAYSEAAIDLAAEQKNTWLENRGRQNRVIKCDLHQQFLKNLSHVRDPHFTFSALEMRCADKPISWELGFEFKGTHYVYITAHREELTNLSPGRLHMDLSQRHSLRNGISTFDLMGPADPYKKSWSSSSVPTADFCYGISLSGRLYSWLYLRHLRPVLRSFYLHAPQSLLKQILRLVKLN